MIEKIVIRKSITTIEHDNAHHAHPCSNPFTARAIDAQTKRAFPKLPKETVDERVLDLIFHLRPARMTKDDQERANDRLNNGDKDQSKRNRRYRYRSALV